MKMGREISRVSDPCVESPLFLKHDFDVWNAVYAWHRTGPKLFPENLASPLSSRVGNCTKVHKKIYLSLGQGGDLRSVVSGPSTRL